MEIATGSVALHFVVMRMTLLTRRPHLSHQPLLAKSLLPPDQPALACRSLASLIASALNLSSLTLSAATLGDGGLKAIAKAVAASDRLVSLTLSSCHVSSDGLRALSAALTPGRLPTLASLCLCGNALGNAGAAAAADVAAKLPGLTDLDLSDNYNIAADGVRALAPLLRSRCADGPPKPPRAHASRSVADSIDGASAPPGSSAPGAAEPAPGKAPLLRLNLARNHLGPDGARALARVMADGVDLEELDLERCRVRGEGLLALVPALIASQSLRRISLARNNLGDREAAEVGRMLRENGRIVAVRLGGNVIGTDGARALEAALRWVAGGLL